MADQIAESTHPHQPPPSPAPRSDAAWLPYVLPMAAFLVITTLESSLPRREGTIDPAWYIPAYGLKIGLVAVLVWAFRRNWRDFRPNTTPAALALGALVGILVTVAWVGLDGKYPDIPLLGGRSAYDPTGLPAAQRWAYLLLRGAGLVLLVPVFEELFWRSFLMRLAIDMDDFTRVPVGRVTLAAGLITAVLFALAHPEWLPALLAGLAWSALLARTRSLAACLVSHVVANLTLILYVLATNTWHFL